MNAPAKRYNVYDQKFPRKITDEEWAANMKLLGTVEARSSGEAMSLAKRRYLVSAPVLEEKLDGK